MLKQFMTTKPQQLMKLMLPRTHFFPISRKQTLSIESFPLTRVMNQTNM